MSKVPDQCKLCANFTEEEGICSIYEMLPGEYDRKDVKDCPSFFESNQEEELKALAKYIDEDPDHIVEASLMNVVNKVVSGYEDKFKIMVVGVARRKIKAMVRMVDIIDSILERLSRNAVLEDMSNSQMIRLLSELNYSINNDLTFIMKLVNPDSTLRDLQVWLDARSVINVNGASDLTEKKSEEILNITNVSRDKIRDAFDAILNNIKVEGVEEEHVATEEELEEITNYE